MLRSAAFILPRNDNDGCDLADVHLALQSTLVDTFGGFTALESRGGWRDPSNGRLYVEPGLLYQIGMEDSAECRAQLESIALFYGHMAKQICIMVQHANGEIIFVDIPQRGVDVDSAPDNATDHDFAHAALAAD